MSFIEESKQGKVHAAGWFLVNNEDCTRLTKTAPASGAIVTTVGSAKYIKMGTPYPSNDANAIGIVYEDVDVTSGAMPCSVVTKGEVYVNRLPVELAANAKTALAGLGFKFITTEPTVTRPY